MISYDMNMFRCVRTPADLLYIFYIKNLKSITLKSSIWNKNWKVKFKIIEVFFFKFHWDIWTSTSISFCFFQRGCETYIGSSRMRKSVPGLLLIKVICAFNLNACSVWEIWKFKFFSVSMFVKIVLKK